MSEIDRDVLFGNERLLIGMLQAVSGASVVAAISQWEALEKHAGLYGVLFFVTAMAVALMLAVLAAYWKHDYKKWDVKASVSDAEVRVAVGERNPQRVRFHEREGKRRRRITSIYLEMMRGAMLAATILILVGIGALVGALWLTQLGFLPAYESVLI